MLVFSDGQHTDEKIEITRLYKLILSKSITASSMLHKEGIPRGLDQLRGFGIPTHAKYCTSYTVEGVCTNHSYCTPGLSSTTLLQLIINFVRRRLLTGTTTDFTRFDFMHMLSHNSLNPTPDPNVQSPG